MRPLLDGLYRPSVDAPKRALVLPVFHDFRPTKPAWDGMLDFVRRGSTCRVDVFGFLRPFGPVPELLLGDVWGILKYVDDSEEALSEEGSIRTRRFMMGADDYDRIVLFAYGPSMSTWSSGAIGTPAVAKTELVKLRSEYDGISDPRLHRRIRKLLSLDASSGEDD